MKPAVCKANCHIVRVWHLINAPTAAAVLPLQSAWRGHVARKEAARLRRERAATRLQAIWRMHRQRAAFQLQRRCAVTWLWKQRAELGGGWMGRLLHWVCLGAVA